MASFWGHLYVPTQQGFSSDYYCYYYNPNNLYINPTASVYNCVYTGYPSASIEWEKYNDSYSPDYSYYIEIKNLNIGDNLSPYLNVFGYTPINYTSENYSEIKYSESEIWMISKSPTIVTSYVNFDIYAYDTTTYNRYYVDSKSFYISTYIYINDNYGDTNTSSAITLNIGETKYLSNLSTYYECGSVKQYGNNCIDEDDGGKIKGISAGTTTVVYYKKLKNGYINVNDGSPTGSCSGYHTFTITVNSQLLASSITQNNITKTYGDANFTITPTVIGVSKLTWKLSNSTVVSTVSTGTNGKSATFKILKPGTVTVTLTGTGASGYSNPSSKSFTITVSKNSSGFTPSSYTKTVNGVDYPSLHFSYTVQSNSSTVFNWYTINNYITSNSSTCYINRPPTPQTLMATLQRADDIYYAGKSLDISVTFTRKDPTFHSYSSLSGPLTIAYGSTYVINNCRTTIDTGGTFYIESDYATTVSSTTNSVTIKGSKLGTGTIEVHRNRGTWWNEAYAYEWFPITVIKGSTSLSLNKSSVTLWINHPSNASSTTVTPTISGSNGSAYWNTSNSGIATVSGNRSSATITSVSYGSCNITCFIEDNDYYNKSETKTVAVTVYRYYDPSITIKISNRTIPNNYYVFATSSTIVIRLTFSEGGSNLMNIITSKKTTNNGVVTNISKSIIDASNIDYTITVNTTSDSYDTIELGLFTSQYVGKQYFVVKSVKLHVTRISLSTLKRIITNNYLFMLYNVTAPGDPNTPGSTDWCPTKNSLFDTSGNIIFNVNGEFANNQLVPQCNFYVIASPYDIYKINNHVIPNIDFEKIAGYRQCTIIITGNTSQSFYYGETARLDITYKIQANNTNTNFYIPLVLTVNGTVSTSYSLENYTTGNGKVTITFPADTNNSVNFTLTPQYNYLNGSYYLDYNTGWCHLADTKTVTASVSYKKRDISTTVYISSSSAGTNISSSLSKEATTSFTLYARVKENNTSSYLSISASDFDIEFTTAYGSISNKTTQSSNEIKFTVNLNSNTGSSKVAVNFKGKSNSTINYKTSSKEVTINVIEKPTVAPMPEVYYVTCSNTNYSAANGNYITIYPTFKLYNPNNNIITTYIGGITVSSSTQPSLGNWSISMDSNFSSTGKYTISGTFAVVGNSYFDIYLTIPSGNSSYYATIPITISGY